MVWRLLTVSGKQAMPQGGVSQLDFQVTMLQVYATVGHLFFKMYFSKFCKMYFSEPPITYISKCTHQNYKTVFPRLQNVLTKLQNRFLQIERCICQNWQIHLYKEGTCQLDFQVTMLWVNATASHSLLRGFFDLLTWWKVIQYWYLSWSGGVPIMNNLSLLEGGFSFWQIRRSFQKENPSQCHFVASLILNSQSYPKRSPPNLIW